jgi:hypothetical protein
MRELVKNGYLTFNEPTDLPDGTVVPLEILGRPRRRGTRRAAS